MEPVSRLDVDKLTDEDIIYLNNVMVDIRSYIAVLDPIPGKRYQIMLHCENNPKIINCYDYVILIGILIGPNMLSCYGNRNSAYITKLQLLYCSYLSFQSRFSHSYLIFWRIKE